MVAQDIELRAEALTNLFLTYVDRKLENPDFNFEQVSGLPEALSTYGGTRSFEDVPDHTNWPMYFWYPKYGLHEWEPELFHILIDYMDVIIASVLSPLAVSIAQDKAKKAYKWARGKLFGTIREVSIRYSKKNVTNQGEIQRFDSIRSYIDKGMEVLERTGMNDFTTDEFAQIAGITEDLVPPLLILCQFRQSDSRWRRSVR